MTKIFCDIADINLIKKFDRKKIVKGFTTNPSLMRKAGAKDYQNYSKKILGVTKKPISFEVFADNSKEMLKQAQNMKSQMKKIKKELESIEVEGVSANGACKVIMTADMKTQDVKIDETLLSSEAYVIENAVKVAVNDALEDAKDTSAKKLKAVTGGLTDGLPGF